MELDLRALKQALQMDVLPCKSPGLVRKEVWAHLLAYNVLRGVLADAARAAALVPVQVSFKGTLQAVNAFAAALWTAGPEPLLEMVRRLREVVVANQVGGRPNRYEPRRRKRRPKPYPLLNEPRPQARRRLAGKRCA
jgi:hypothetical protein